MKFLLEVLNFIPIMPSNTMLIALDHVNNSRRITTYFVRLPILAFAKLQRLVNGSNFNLSWVVQHCTFCACQNNKFFIKDDDKSQTRPNFRGKPRCISIDSNSRTSSPRVKVLPLILNPISFLLFPLPLFSFLLNSIPSKHNPLEPKKLFGMLKSTELMTSLVSNQSGVPISASLQH